MYKKFDIREDLHNPKRPSDLLCVDVIYPSNISGVVYLNRATVNRILFEMKYEGKIIKSQNFEDYRDLILEEERMERSFDEEY